MGSDDSKPSLEAPSLGLRRRKRPPARSGEPASEPEQPAADEAADTTSVDVPEPDPTHQPAPEPAPAPVGVKEPKPPKLPKAPKPPRPPRAPRGPMNGRLAAVISGIAVGAFLVLATLGGLQACESVRGTTSCGGGPGFLLLVLIIVLAVVIGGLVLRWAQVPSAGSISFLAVALVAVLSGLFLLDSLDQVAGAVAVALLSVASYALAHEVTVRYIDAAD